MRGWPSPAYLRLINIKLLRDLIILRVDCALNRDGHDRVLFRANAAVALVGRRRGYRSHTTTALASIGVLVRFLRIRSLVPGVELELAILIVLSVLASIDLPVELLQVLLFLRHVHGSVINCALLRYESHLVEFRLSCHFSVC